jgi:catechol 2,3-dioxygenase-like lactoylglutathione lyase family enzyme
MIHHVLLSCPAGSEERLRSFYAGVLGLTEIEKPSALAARGGCWFRGHGIELHLGVEADFRPARKAHPGLLVAGIDAWAGPAGRGRVPGRVRRRVPRHAPLLQRGPAEQLTRRT